MPLTQLLTMKVAVESKLMLKSCRGGLSFLKSWPASCRQSQSRRSVKDLVRTAGVGIGQRQAPWTRSLPAHTLSVDFLLFYTTSRFWVSSHVLARIGGIVTACFVLAVSLAPCSFFRPLVDAGASRAAGLPESHAGWPQPRDAEGKEGLC